MKFLLISKKWTNVCGCMSKCVPISPLDRSLRHLNVGHPLPVKSSSFISTFHSSAISKAKSFQEKENEYAHTVMEKVCCYEVLRFPLSSKLQMPLESSKELSQFAEATNRALECHLSLEDSNFFFLTRNITSKLPNISDKELIQFLHFLCLWPPSPKSYSPNFKAMWNGIDYQCTYRFKNWNMSLRLLVADYWFTLRLSRISQYNRSLIENLLQDIGLLSDHHVVQLMFYINLQRKVPPSHMATLEKKLLPIINRISIEEVGIICLGFFKTENKILDFDVIQSIIDRLCIGVGSAPILTVNAILKFLKKSIYLPKTYKYIPLLHKCIPFVSNWDVPTSVHLALLSSECHVYNPLLLNTITKKLLDEMDKARIKDCTKLLQCLSHFNHNIELPFLSQYFLELQKQSRHFEIEQFPRDLAYSTLYSAYMGYFDYDCIRKVLHPEFVRYCQEVCPDTKFTFAEIDCCVEIECPDYQGPRLLKEELRILKSRRGNFEEAYLSKSLVRIMKSSLEYLEELLKGQENILVRHILPHCFSPDIIVRLSKNSTSMSRLYGNFSPNSILMPPRNEVWACFVMSTSFSFAYKSRHVTGITAMKLRQLEKLGYKTVFVPYYDLPLNLLSNKKFLQNKLDSLYKYNQPLISITR